MTIDEILDLVIEDDSGDIVVFDDPTKLAFVFANNKTMRVVGHLRINQVPSRREKVALALRKAKENLLA